MEDPAPYGNQKPSLHWQENELYYHDLKLCYWWIKSSGIINGKRILVKLSFPVSEKFNDLESVKSVTAFKKAIENEARLFIEKVKKYEL